MTTVLGTDFAAEMSAAFAGQLEPATLHVATETVDGYGQSSRSFADTAIDATVTKWSEQTKVARMWPMETVKVLMLAHGKPKPGNSDEITIRSARYRILDVMDGGAEAIWNIAGVKL